MASRRFPWLIVAGVLAVGALEGCGASSDDEIINEGNEDAVTLRSLAGVYRNSIPRTGQFTLLELNSDHTFRRETKTSGDLRIEVGSWSLRRRIVSFWSGEPDDSRRELMDQYTAGLSTRGATTRLTLSRRGVRSYRMVKDPPADSDCASRRGGALITFRIVAETVTLWITDSTFIDEAKERVGAGTGRVPNFGKVIPGRSCDDRYSWHVDPADVQWDDISAEVCDGLPSYIEDHLGDWLEQVRNYCPWSAEVDSVDDRR